MAIVRSETNRRMSRSVVFNNMVFLCGQTAKEWVPDIQEQTRTTLEKVDALLEASGSNRKQILSATVYLKHMTDFDAMNKIWDAWVPEGHAPARACVRADMAKEDILVEISVIAAIC